MRLLEPTDPVWPDVAPAQAVKTLIHELAHALLHSDEFPRSKEVAEVEVESVAYIVCDAIGLDSGAYSFAYIARWAEGSPQLVRAGERAIRCAGSILKCLEVTPYKVSPATPDAVSSTPWVTGPET